MSNSGKGGRHSRTGHEEPPSPPLSDGQGLQYGLHHLQHHNAATRYQPSHQTYGNSINTYGTNTTFSSPEQRQVSMNPYEASRCQSAFDSSQLGYEYDGFGNTAYYENPSGAHGYQQSHGYQSSQYPAPISYFGSSPPTPVLSDQDGGVRRVLRSNLPNVPIVPSQTLRSYTPEGSRSVRSTKTARPKKQAKDNEKAKVPKLTAPLSVLTKSYDHIPIKDMNAWVNRSDESRMKDVRKKNGYITRPMNSFMMYRSAYAERTKIWCLQNNHQVVSAVSGESWPMEPPEVRDLYIEYARRERENHAKAHPGYKFQPTKMDTSSKKRKGTQRELSDEEASDLEDTDYEWRTTVDRKGKGKARIFKPALDDYIPSSLERSTYGYNNPGKPLPRPIGQELSGQHWQQKVNLVADPLYYPSSQVEDVSIRQAEAPIDHVHGPSLIGLPGQQHFELLNLQSWDESHLFDSSYNFFPGHDDFEPPIDPQLGTILPGYDYGYPEATFQDFDDKSSSFGIASTSGMIPQTAAVTTTNGMLVPPYTVTTSSGMTASRYSTVPVITSQPAMPSQDGSREAYHFDQEDTSSGPPPKSDPWATEEKGNTDGDSQTVDPIVGPSTN